MKPHHLTLGLSALNLALLALTLAGRAPSVASAAPPGEVAAIVRARALELVGEDGQIRARLNVEVDGEVVLRLVDRSGAIRVKLGAGEDGSGLLLLDEDSEPGVHMIARRVATAARPATTGLILRGAGGREKVIRP